MLDAFDEGRQLENHLPQSVVFLDMLSNPAYKPVRLHYHEYMELLYAVDGEFEVLTSGGWTYMHSGDMVFINAYEAHGVGCRTDSGRHYCIKFLSNVICPEQETLLNARYRFFGKRSLLPAIEHFTSERISDAGVAREFENAFVASDGKKTGYEFELRAALLKIMAFVLRESLGSELSLPHNDIQTALIMETAQEYVRRNYSSATLSGAAEACSLSYSYFSRIFRKTFSMSFCDYVNTVRVYESQRLLSETNDSITEIALSVGFSTASYYIKIFREIKGISPNKFRKLLGQI